MQRKLKAVLHRRKKSTSMQSPRSSYEHSGESSPSSPQAEHHSTSSGDPHHTGHSRPLSSAYHDRHMNSPTVPQPATGNFAQGSNSDLNGSIADDYRSYLPVLSPDGDSDGKQYATLGGDRRLIIGESDGRHGEHVADRNIDRYRASFDEGQSKLLPAVPGLINTSLENPRKNLIGTGSAGSTIRSVPSEPKHGHGETDGHDWRAKQQSLLSSVVDLKNTVDTDRDTKWAPAVTHEIIKPHEHEVFRRVLHREIHNYKYYHRLQPVRQTEVLPPRHFIPNPDGEGLIEISADELPQRTGSNRWWDIMQKETPFPETSQQWRTEPEVIEGKPYITKEGFQRKETTIIYPPTLADMSEYRGMVQPVHFDHKTGERWLGPVTTMDKLKADTEPSSDADFMVMKQITSNLPEVSRSPTVKRKPVRESL
ncbi:hypothetical protein EJ02DRAFT_93955 [Clathrospora elynae]|uniref:Uncharacterized protein n=1 Tax=Clathrospora elynae TaxID=706981 RepID=A0A6A5SX55_9PLEO|nr:hypothetical protein EJ02DRAFT_93955 [Clathrospora elynae]